MKKDGSRPLIVKRLFQSLKLTESALRHVRRCQALDMEEGSAAAAPVDLNDERQSADGP
jgi:hypothetical protein